MISIESFGNKLMQIIPTKGKQKHLVAVSGGLDSMTLLYLLNKLLPGQIHAAHCNYQLRGNESEQDEELVNTFCKNQHIKLHKIKFDTLAEKNIAKTGIQETARNLRYTWFDKLRNQNNYMYIFTAHHADDNAESILLNISRGSGLNGLKGISPINNYIVRPLLDFTKTDLLNYAQAVSIPFRNDKSNLKNDYKRNRIRNKVIPELNKVNSSFVQHINELSEIAQSALEILNNETTRFINEKCNLKEDGILIPIIEIQQLVSPKYFLTEILFKYGFNKSQVTAIYGMLGHSSGKYFYSSDHRLIISKKEIIIDKGLEKPLNEVIKEIPYSFETNHYKISIKIQRLKSTFKFKQESNMLIVDAEKINLDNITLTSWNKGEKFQPFGMKNNKKISDFFIDRKISIKDKEDALVLKSNNKVVAVLPHEIDNNFKVNKDTKTILRIAIKQKAPN